MVGDGLTLYVVTNKKILAKINLITKEVEDEIKINIDEIL